MNKYPLQNGKQLIRALVLLLMTLFSKSATSQVNSLYLKKSRLEISSNLSMSNTEAFSINLEKIKPPSDLLPYAELAIKYSKGIPKTWFNLNSGLKLSYFEIYNNDQFFNSQDSIVNQFGLDNDDYGSKGSFTKEFKSVYLGVSLGTSRTKYFGLIHEKSNFLEIGLDLFINIPIYYREERIVIYQNTEILTNPSYIAILTQIEFSAAYMFYLNRNFKVGPSFFLGLSNFSRTNNRFLIPQAGLGFRLILL